MSNKQAEHLRTPRPPKGAGNVKPFDLYNRSLAKGKDLRKNKSSLKNAADQPSSSAKSARASNKSKAQKPNFSVPRERASNTSTARRTNYQVLTSVLSTSSSDASVPDYNVPVVDPPPMTPDQQYMHDRALYGSNVIPNPTRIVQSPYSTGSTISYISTGSSMSIDEPPVVGGAQDDKKPPASTMLTNLLASMKPFAASLASVADNAMFSEFIAFLTGRDHKPVRWVVTADQIIETPLGNYVFNDATKEYMPLSNSYEKPWTKEKRVGYVMDNSRTNYEVVVESKSDLEQIPISSFIVPVTQKSPIVRHTDLKNYSGKISFKDESKKSYLKRQRAHNAAQARLALQAGNYKP